MSQSQAAYKDYHILFLQSLMQTPALNKLDAQELGMKCCEACESEFDGDIIQFIEIINEQIQPFHLKIKRGIKENTGETIVALINLNDNEVNQVTIGANYNKAEIEIFQLTLKLILTSSNGLASSMDVLNLNDEITQKHVTKSDIEVKLRSYFK